MYRSKQIYSISIYIDRHTLKLPPREDYSEVSAWHVHACMQTSRAWCHRDRVFRRHAGKDMKSCPCVQWKTCSVQAKFDT